MAKMRFGWKPTKARSKSGKRANGQISQAAVLCLMTTLGLTSLVCARMESRAWLARANAQSQLDLAVLSQAEGFWKENEYTRKCTGEIPETVRVLEIENCPVTMTDFETYVLCEYGSVTLQVWLDQQGILEIVWL